MKIYRGPFVNDYGKYEAGIDADLEAEEAYHQCLLDRDSVGWDDYIPDDDDF